MRRKIIAAVLGATALAGVTAAPAVADATAAARYGGQCGSGYSVVNSFDLPSGRGSVFLTYNAGNRKNCVVTVRTTSGTATLVEAFLRKSSDAGWAIDSGNYTAYAGPVHVSAPGACVDWGGTIGTATDARYGTNCG
ncbi:spore-associated protein A [Saccharopolyspora sp. MS10]|uniref:spore-associated protein A n=1 Tax=Saccharopolyspora sp. MS10 TaxID=3385973 RepID=UPI0039A3E254